MDKKEFKSPQVVDIPLPEGLWHYKRCQELARVIHEYFEAGWDPEKEWIDELARRWPVAEQSEPTNEDLFRKYAGILPKT